MRGLGDGELVEALKSTNNIIKIGDAVKLNQDLYAIFDANLNLTPKLGFPVHGIIGNDIFKDLIVEINYSKKYLKLIQPDVYRYKNCKKCETFNLEFYNNKPYMNVEVTINNKDIPVKLLIDSGGSDVLWLFEDDSLGIISNNKYFEDFLGHGLSGSIYGKGSKIGKLSLKSFVLEDANVAYPDSMSIQFARTHKERNGSLAGNILKRFNMVFDYQKATVTLKKNGYFKEKFSYNKSGIELAHDGVRFVKEFKNETASGYGVEKSNNGTNNTKYIINPEYKLTLKPAYTVAELRANSPAQKAGLLIGDVILTINGKPSHQFSLQDLMYEFVEEAGKRIRLKVDRNGKELNFSFNLENPY